MPADLRRNLLALVPSLRAFAFCLMQDRDEADDIVHRSLVEIWRRHASLAGMELRVAAFGVVDAQARLHALAKPGHGRRPPDAPAPRVPKGFAGEFAALPRSAREAVSLVGMCGFSIKQAAGICGTDGATVRICVELAFSRLSHPPARPQRPAVRPAPQAARPRRLSRAPR